MSEPTNCLAEYRCPKCTARRGFRIEGATVTLTIDLYDAGTDELETHGTDWADNCPMSCHDCDHKGVVADFRISNQQQATP